MHNGCRELLRMENVLFPTSKYINPIKVGSGHTSNNPHYLKIEELAPNFFLYFFKHIGRFTKVFLSDFDLPS